MIVFKVFNSLHEFMATVSTRYGLALVVGAQHLLSIHEDNSQKFMIDAGSLGSLAEIDFEATAQKAGVHIVKEILSH